ncbi:MAG: MalM family protein [Pseudomonadota bacterium]
MNRRKRLVRVALAASTFVIAACATPYKEAIRPFESAEPCCESMADLPFRMLAVERKEKIELNTASPAFNFDSGKSYFTAFELPPFSGPYRIVIESLFVGDNVSTSYVFYPHILTLDESHNIIRSSGKGLFAVRRAGLTETWGYLRKLSGSIEVCEKNRDERFLVIMTTEELLHLQTPELAWSGMPVVIPSAGVFGYIPTGKELKQIPHSPVGKLTIWIESVEKCKQ